MLRLGFLGTGALAAAVITALEQDHSADRRILISPRSEEISKKLAASYRNVERAESNAAVVEKSDVVLLGVRPQQLIEATTDLPFRADQIVVSFLAATAHDLVAERVRPATVCRVIPLPPIRLRQGPIVVYPSNSVVETLFSGMGDVIVADRESDLVALTNASALMSSFYEFQNTAVEWLISRSVPQPCAELYVRSMFGGLSNLALTLAQNEGTLDPAEYETKGGLNEHARLKLQTSGWFEQVKDVIDAIESKVMARSGD